VDTDENEYWDESSGYNDRYHCFGQNMYRCSYWRRQYYNAADDSYWRCYEGEMNRCVWYGDNDSSWNDSWNADWDSHCWKRYGVTKCYRCQIYISQDGNRNEYP